jgi:hypothetical protein
MGAFATSRLQKMIQVHGQLGYEIAGTFTPVCDLRGFHPAQQGRARDMLEDFLEGTPAMHRDSAAGLMTFSIADGGIYCHLTPQYFKIYCAPGSGERMRAIDDWMKVNLTPEQYAEARKKPVRKLEGVELDAWAEARAAENEREIASLKRSGGRVGKTDARITAAKPAAGRSI